MSALITRIGNEKLAVATPISPVTIKSIAVGSGTGPYDENISALKNQVWIGDSSAPQKLGAQLSFTCHIPANVGGWTITEWGLIDSVGDLIAYGQLDEPVNKPLGFMSFEPVFTIELGSSTETELVVTDVLNFDHNFMNNRDKPDAHPISAITGLQLTLDNIDLDIETKDSQNVKLSGNQVIQGEKTFNGTIHFETATNGDSQITMDGLGTAMSCGAVSIVCDGETNVIYVLGGPLTGDGSGLDAPTTAKKGAIQLATQAEVNTGTDAVKAVTPATLKGFLNATGSAPVYGARAWCSFIGTTGVIRGQGNIASITRTAVGTYDVVFTTPMPDANYSVVGSTSSGASAVSIGPEGGAKTVNGFRLNAWYGGDNSVGKFDPAYADFTVYR